MILSTLLTLCLIQLNGAQPPPTVVMAAFGAAKPGASVATVTTVNGTERRGVVRRWRLDEALVLASPDGGEIRIESRDVDTVAYPHQPREPARGDWEVLLANGSRIRADIAGGAGERIAFRAASFGEFAADFSSLRALNRVGSDGSPPGEPPPRGAAPVHAARPHTATRRGEPHPARKSDPGDRPSGRLTEDLVTLTGGGVIRGAVAQVDRDRVSIFEGRSQRDVPWTTVQAVRFAEVEAPKGDAALTVRIVLRDGSECCAKAIEWRSDEIAADIDAARPVRIPFDAVGRLEVEGGRRVRLADLPVDEFTERAYFDLTRGYALNQNALGGPLRLGGRTFARGIGLASGSRISWRLDGRFQRFRCVIGLDDAAHRGGSPCATCGHGDVDIRIDLDDRPAWRMDGLTSRSGPQSVDLAVAGARRLTIEVAFGRWGNVCDWVDVVDAALVRP